MSETENLHTCMHAFMHACMYVGLNCIDVVSLGFCGGEVAFLQNYLIIDKKKKGLFLRMFVF